MNETNEYPTSTLRAGGQDSRCRSLLLNRKITGRNFGTMQTSDVVRAIRFRFSSHAKRGRWIARYSARDGGGSAPSAPFDALRAPIPP
jgi:hypothetical protein